jgi:hypothetical protein
MAELSRMHRLGLGILRFRIQVLNELFHIWHGKTRFSESCNKNGQNSVRSIVVGITKCIKIVGVHAKRKRSAERERTPRRMEDK